MDSVWWIAVVTLNAAWAAAFMVARKTDARLMRSVRNQLSITTADARRARHDVQQLTFVVRMQQDQLNTQKQTTQASA